MTLYTHTSANIRRTWLLMSVFLVFVIGLGWVFSEVFQSRDILFFSVAIAFLMNFFSYWFSDKIALAMHHAREISREQAPELYRIIENLSITAGLPMPRIYVVEDSAPNAFATGRNVKHAVVAVTTGLLERLDRSELEGVLAHELSHIGNKDMLVGTVAVVLAGFISLLADFFLRSLWFGAGRRDDREGGGAHPIFLAVAIAAAILAPIAAMLIQFAISRKREFLADASGALLTRYPEGLARALEKIGSYARPMLSARTATAHLWLNDPFGKPERTSWLMRLFMTHPSLEERVAILRSMNI